MNVAFESCVVMKNIVIMALNDPSVSIMAVLYLRVIVISENAVELLPPSAGNFFISVYIGVIAWAGQLETALFFSSECKCTKLFCFEMNMFVFGIYLLLRS